MGFDANRLTNNEIVKTQQTGVSSGQAAQTNSPSSTTPIDFSSKSEKVLSEIVEFINSDEFKSLPPEQQKQKLFERFPALKTMSDEQIKQYITTAKQTVENQRTTETETSQTAESTQDTSKQSELEKLINEYLKQEKSDINDIDKLIAKLHSKEKSGELTDLEKKILEKYNAANQSETDKNQNAQEQNSHSLKHNHRIDKFLSEEQIEKIHNPKTTDKEKLMIYMDADLKRHDKEYAALTSKEAKIQYLDKKIGDIIPEWKNKTPEQKDKIINDQAQEYMTLINALNEDGKTLKDLKNMSASQKNAIVMKYKDNHGIPESPLDTAEQNIIAEIQAGDTNKQVSYQEIEKVLLEKEKAGTLTEAESGLLEKYKLMKRMDKHSMKEHVYTGVSLSERIKNEHYDNLDEYLDDKIKPNMSRREVVEIIAGMENDQIETIAEKLQSMGYSDEEIKKIFFAHKAHIEAHATRDTPAAEVFAQSQAQYIKDDTVLVQVGENTLQHQELIKPFAQGINTYRPDNEAVQISAILASSTRISDASRAQFSQSIVETAQTAQRQLMLGKILSKIKNAAVTEGLAAASNSVDSSVINQYISHIEAAMKNYPPAQQAAIRTALETGTISQQTLSKTELPAQQIVSDNQPLQKSSMQQSLNPQQDLNVVQTQTGFRTESAPSVKTTENTSDKPTQQTVNTQNTTNVSTPTVPLSQLSEQETIELAQKAQVLMDKIENFQKEQSQSIKNWEEVQAAKSKSSVEELTQDSADAQEIPEEIAQYADLELDESEKAVLKQVLTEMFTSNSISRAFEELGKKFGENTQMKFLEVFASKGSLSDIRAFAENFKSNPQIILTLFQFSQDQSLLKYLDNTDILNLYYTGKITNIDAIKDRYDVISKIIEDGMKNGQNRQELGNLITYLPADFQGALLKSYPDLAKNVPGTDEWLKNSISNGSKNDNTQAADYETTLENKQDDILFANNPTATTEAAINPTLVPNHKYEKNKKRNGHIYIA